MKIIGILLSFCLSPIVLADESTKEEIQKICPGPGGGWQFGCYQFFVAVTSFLLRKNV